MKKLSILLLISFFTCGSLMAQSGFFTPLKKQGNFQSGRLGISLDSVIKSIRPVVVLTATVSDGAQLAGGAGFGYQSNKWDASSQSYITQYSISAVGLLGTTGLKLTGTGAIVIGVPGTNGLIGLGGGYDFTLKEFVFVSGVQIKFN